MKYKIFSIYDSKTEAYMQPFFSPTKGHAIRMWQDTISDKNSQFAKHPADFTLFEIGEYNDHNAQVTSLMTPLSLGSALEHTKE